MSALFAFLLTLSLPAFEVRFRAYSTSQDPTIHLPILAQAAARAEAQCRRKGNHRVRDAVHGIDVYLGDLGMIGAEREWGREDIMWSRLVMNGRPGLLNTKEHGGGVCLD